MKMKKNRKRQADIDLETRIKYEKALSYKDGYKAGFKAAKEKIIEAVKKKLAEKQKETD